MGAERPRVRRRGFFLHSSDSGDPDMSHGGDHESPEGFGVRVRVARESVPRQATGSGRSHTSSRSENTNPQIRSGSVTGSRQRAHLPR
jgi:hypothetical protein